MMTSAPQKINPWLCILVYSCAASAGTFAGGLWAALAIGGAIALFIVDAGVHRRFASPDKHVVLFAILALAVFAAEIPFSANAALSVKVWARLCSIFLPLVLLSSPELQKTCRSDFFLPVVVLSAVVGAVGLGLELQSGGAFLHVVRKADAPLSEFNRGIAHLVILIFPLLAGLWRAQGRNFAVALALIVFFPTFWSESHTAQLAFSIGIACTLIASVAPTFTRRCLAFSFASLLGWPFYAQWIFSVHHQAVESLHNSWLHRMEIWDYLSYRIDERPFLGWGLGSTPTLDFAYPHGDLYRLATSAAPHAHNFIVQLWVETGIPGLGLVFILMLLILRSIKRLDTPLQPFALGSFAAAVTVSSFGFDFWTDALWSAFALSAFAFALLQQSEQRAFDSVTV